MLNLLQLNLSDDLTIDHNLLKTQNNLILFAAQDCPEISDQKR